MTYKRTPGLFWPFLGDKDFICCQGRAKNMQIVFKTDQLPKQGLQGSSQVRTEAWVLWNEGLLVPGEAACVVKERGGRIRLSWALAFYLRSPSKVPLTKRTSVNKCASMFWKLHGGIGVMQAWNWPSRVTMRGSITEAHIPLEPRWGVGTLVFFLSDWLQRHLPTSFDTEYGTKTVFLEIRKKEIVVMEKSSESKNMWHFKDRSGTLWKQLPVAWKASLDTECWARWRLS